MKIYCQHHMFQSGEDLPLFSGTAQRTEEPAPVEQAQPWQQARLIPPPDMATLAAELKAINRARGE